MNRQFGLSQFIHALPYFSDAMQASNANCWTEQYRYRQVVSRLPCVIDREALLLPALIAALFDYDESYGAWPPARVTDLLDLAGLDGATTKLHLEGSSISTKPNHGPISRELRQAVLLAGLGALDAGLLVQTGQRFDELSHSQRAEALSAFERGELNFSCEQAERFMDCIVETVTFAFLNFELDASLPA